MADPDRPRKTPKVSKATLDSMRRMGMTKAIEKANTHGASAEFVEGAKRMYGNRINTPAGAGKKEERPPDRVRKVDQPPAPKRASQNVQKPKKK